MIMVHFLAVGVAVAAVLCLVGNGIAAAVMGLCGTYVSNRAVFWLTAVLMVPGMVALLAIRREDMAAPGSSRASLPQADRVVPPALFGVVGTADTGLVPCAECSASRKPITVSKITSATSTPSGASSVGRPKRT